MSRRYEPRIWPWVLAFVLLLVLAASCAATIRTHAIENCHAKGGQVVSSEWWQGGEGAGTYWHPSCVERGK